MIWKEAVAREQWVRAGQETQHGVMTREKSARAKPRTTQKHPGSNLDTEETSDSHSPPTPFMPTQRTRPSASCSWYEVLTRFRNMARARMSSSAWAGVAPTARESRCSEGRFDRPQRWALVMSAVATSRVAPSAAPERTAISSHGVGMSITTAGGEAARGDSSVICSDTTSSTRAACVTTSGGNTLSGRTSRKTQLIAECHRRLASIRLRVESVKGRFHGCAACSPRHQPPLSVTCRMNSTPAPSPSWSLPRLSTTDSCLSEPR
mmetsp:Transcript_18122/g.54670  ORF Transcript_18122/g.54670 Transcript_18122/m.54670 type:complete len:264 (-) Transcript_18122:403-1194(-)